MSKNINHTGEKFITNEGYEVEIIEYFGWDNCTIKFSEDLILYEIQYHNLKIGNVRNPFHKSLHKTGYMGVGRHKSKITYKTTKTYSTWNGMIARGYYKKYKEKHHTYQDVTVCEEWHNFQVFAKWFEENWKPCMDNTWNLDKDILIKGNKIYSPETCCFVPQEINKLLIIPNNSKILPIGVRYNKKLDKYQARLTIGKKEKYLGYSNTPEEAFQVYKDAKEKHIREVADKWKGLISDRVYEAMYNYQVEITD
jgi:hypothetical protein